MYKIISIDEYVMTRDIKVENLDSGTQEICFDYSYGAGKEDFEFIQINKTYEMKIALYGSPIREKIKNALECEIISENEIVGIKKMVKVIVDKDEYYISKDILESFLHQKVFYFDCSRKDIIQINKVVHGNFLR